MKKVEYDGVVTKIESIADETGERVVLTIELYKPFRPRSPGRDGTKEQWEDYRKMCDRYMANVRAMYSFKLGDIKLIQEE